ncbi:hypothetical protein HK405_015979 [Cladochytrium tenue]|nr:hypothetical protein HK405_015979 [Cladochytrium tenue]
MSIMPDKYLDNGPPPPMPALPNTQSRSPPAWVAVGTSAVLPFPTAGSAAVQNPPIPASTSYVVDTHGVGAHDAHGTTAAGADDYRPPALTDDEAFILSDAVQAAIREARRAGQLDDAVGASVSATIRRRRLRPSDPAGKVDDDVEDANDAESVAAITVRSGDGSRPPTTVLRRYVRRTPGSSDPEAPSDPQPQSAPAAVAADHAAGWLARQVTVASSMTVSTSSSSPFKPRPSAARRWSWGSAISSASAAAAAAAASAAAAAAAAAGTTPTPYAASVRSRESHASNRTVRLFQPAVIATAASARIVPTTAPATSSPAVVRRIIAGVDTVVFSLLPPPPSVTLGPPPPRTLSLLPYLPISLTEHPN